MSLKRRFFLGAAAVLAFFSFCMEPALASQAETKEQVLARLDSAAANFHSTSADVEFDTIETEPVPGTDVQKGVVYYERKNNAVRMGVHLSEHDGHPTAKAYTFIGSTFELFEPGINQVTKYVKAGKWEGYVSLGMGASGKGVVTWSVSMATTKPSLPNSRMICLCNRNGHAWVFLQPYSLTGCAPIRVIRLASDKKRPRQLREALPGSDRQFLRGPALSFYIRGLLPSALFEDYVMGMCSMAKSVREARRYRCLP